MNAYELADELEDVDASRYREIAADMLRQQADRIDKLEREAVAKNNYLEQHCEKIDQQADRIAELEKQTKPLSEDEIYEIWERFNGEIKNFARAIEERHGIK